MSARVVLGKIYHLSTSDKWFFFRAVLLALFVRAYVKLFGFKQVMKIITPFSNLSNTTQYQPVDIKNYNKLSVLCYRSCKILVNCLSVSIAFWTLMRRRGIITEMKFGMKLADKKLKAHAWLEFEGHPFTDGDKINVNYKSFSQSIL